MRHIVLKNICHRFDTLLALATSLEPSMICTTLDVPANKSVGAHMWCIVGARESYSRAIKAGQWGGFACSLSSTDDLSMIITALTNSAKNFQQIVDDVEVWSSSQDQLLVDLLEHETMHEGQLIRHLYALEQTLPDAMKWA